MRNLRALKYKGPIFELVIACLIGTLCALFGSVKFFKNVDEMLINCISIIVASAVAGISLTAASQRTAKGSVADARKLGRALKGQIKFWLGYLIFGGLAVLTLIVSHGLEWQFIAIPRPRFVPNWIPDTYAWLIFLSMSLVSLQILRVPHIVSAVNSLIDLSTENIVGEIQDRTTKVAADDLDDLSNGSAEKPKPLDPTKFKAH